MKLYRLEPFLNYKIWGGNKLSSLKKLANNGNKVGQSKLGETWEVSRHKDGPSLILGSEKKISDIFSAQELSYLIKFIDTSDHLSVQVHPGDEYAKIHESDSGKTECWIILEAKLGAGIYLGLKPGVTKERLQKAITNKENVNELLNFIPVTLGDFFVVEAGTIHAIGADVLMCEVQQSSGVTYRVWDWNRVDEKNIPRELHVDKAMDVINFSPNENALEKFKQYKNLYSNFTPFKNIFTHQDFELSFYQTNNDNKKIELFFDGKRAVSVVVFSGQIIVDGHEIEAFSSVIIKDCQKLQISSTINSMFIIVS